MNTQLTQCPPAPQTLHFDTYNFEARAQYPVSARYKGLDEWETPGIDFSSYANMQTMTKKLNKGRRLKAPDWAMNDEALQLVLVTYLEQRVFSRKWLADRTEKLSLSERLHRVEEAIASRLPRLIATLEKLCAEYVASNDPARRRRLESLISGIDAQVVIDHSPARIVAAVVYRYWREGLCSVDCGNSVGLTSPAVRQLLFRISETARELGFPEPPTIQTRHGHSEEQRLERIAARKALVTASERRRHAFRLKGESRRRWEAEGMCITCGGERADGFKRCPGCLERVREECGITAPAAA